MAALNINFVTRRRFASPLGLLLLVAGAAMALVVGLDYAEAQAALERTQLRQARLAQQPPAQVAARRRDNAPAPARDESQIKARALAQLHLPWDQVLREVEALADPSVALLSVEAQGQTRSLRFTGEARSMADVVVYVNHLRASHWITSAYLSDHEDKPAGAVRVIRFSLDAMWKAPP